MGEPWNLDERREGVGHSWVQEALYNYPTENRYAIIQCSSGTLGVTQAESKHQRPRTYSYQVAAKATHVLWQSLSVGFPCTVKQAGRNLLKRSLSYRLPNSKRKHVCHPLSRRATATWTLSLFFQRPLPFGPRKAPSGSAPFWLARAASCDHSKVAQSIAALAT